MFIRYGSCMWIIVCMTLFCTACSERRIGLQDALTESRSYEQEASDEEESGSEPVRFLYVHVCGEVVSPGVYELPEGSRAIDAVEAAGGFTDQASRTAVNLAQSVKDGMQLVIPDQETAELAAAKEQEEAAGMVNINTADLSGLCTLNGIGESKAAAIIAYREEHGGFRSTEELMEVSGIGTGVYEQIRDRVFID